MGNIIIYYHGTKNDQHVSAKEEFLRGHSPPSFLMSLIPSIPMGIAELLISHSLKLKKSKSEQLGAFNGFLCLFCIKIA